MRMIYVLGLSLAGAAVLAAVDAGSSGARNATTAPATVAAAAAPAPDMGATEALPPNHPPIGADDSNDGPDSAAVVEGEVEEVLQVDKYTYLRLASGSGEQWAAVPHQDVAVGKRVRIGDATEMQGFSSPTLGKTFDRIWFGVIDEGTAGAAPSPHGGTTGAAPAPASGAVSKADGPTGRTVSEIVGDAAKLRDTTVRVRAKVTKLTAGVLGKTWLHVSDSDKSDLVVTTTGTTSVGAVVLLEGRVATDRDLGSGYRYPVLLEDAKVVESKP